MRETDDGYGHVFRAATKLNEKRWKVMKVSADLDYKFNTKDSQIYIQNRILQAKNPRIVDVIERIELEKQRKVLN